MKKLFKFLAGLTALLFLSIGSSATFAEDEITKLAPYKVFGKIDISQVPDGAAVLTIKNWARSSSLTVILNGRPTTLGAVNASNETLWTIGPGETWIFHKEVFKKGRILKVKLVAGFPVFPSQTERVFDLADQFDKNGNWISGMKWDATMHSFPEKATDKEKAELAALLNPFFQERKAWLERKRRAGLTDTDKR